MGAPCARTPSSPACRFRVRVDISPISSEEMRQAHAASHLCRRPGEDLRRRKGTGRRRPRRPGGHGPGAARPERRGQDHRRARPDHPAAAGQRQGRRRGHRRAQAPQRGPPLDRPLRPVRRRRRVPDRPGEPPDGRPALPDERDGDAKARARRAAGAVQPRRGRRPHRQDLLRRYAPPARPGRRAGRPPAGDVHGRADHRPRPAQPAAAVGGHPGAGRGRHHAAAHHPVPGGGRPPRPRHLRHRPRQGHRPRHLRPAQGPDRRRARRGRRARARPHRRRRPRGAPRFGKGEVTVERAHPQAHRPGHRRRQAARRGHPRAGRPRRSRSTTSACAAPPSTTSSSRSPATPPRLRRRTARARTGHGGRRRADGRPQVGRRPSK